MQEIAAKLQNINQKAKDLTITRDKFGNKIYGGHGYTSVTRALSMPDILGDGARPLIAEFDFDKLWVKLAEKIQEENGGRLSPDELNRMKIETEKKYENIAVLGTAVHKIMEMSFLNPSWDNVTLASEFTKTREYTTSPINDTNVRDAIEYVNKLKDYLKRMHGEDAIFLPELKITSNNDAGKKIVGKIDLLVVDKNGHVHIYDFKASPKSFRDFGKIKELSFHYQMEFYR
jgi:hypothetical protein